MAKQKVIWCCSSCGHKQSKWSGNCPTCHEWNVLIEELSIDERQQRFETARPIFSGDAQRKVPLRIQEINPTEMQRRSTGLKELDRLLGGGLVMGSLTLIGGDPGIGKSTLLLQVSQALAQTGLTVLYVCGEESVEQTHLRATRLNITSDRLYLFSETLFSNVKFHVDQIKPDVLIVDSIQILYKGDIPSAPGSVTQVRELAMEFMHLSKGRGIATFLIGHVTKSGEIAGPRVLEHIVDTVFDFEGDRSSGYRILRGVKNRFGPTDDIALFQMGASGLTEVSNPSEIFLQERKRDTCGSVVIPTIEGSRALLIEVQALVSPTPFATPSRRSTGIDSNRLSLLLAVLQKRVGYQLHRCDVFVSVAGGMKITEPALDLGVLLAISSSFANRQTDPDTVVMGEVGLGGEVRTVPRPESRLKEAIQMGFSRCLLPKRSLKGIGESIRKQITLTGIESVEEAIDVLVR